MNSKPKPVSAVDSVFLSNFENTGTTFTDGYFAAFCGAARTVANTPPGLDLGVDLALQVKARRRLASSIPEVHVQQSEFRFKDKDGKYIVAAFWHFEGTIEHWLRRELHGYAEHCGSENPAPLTPAKSRTVRENEGNQP